MMNTNERIARWLGRELDVPRNPHHAPEIKDAAGRTKRSMAFDADLTLWHGKYGLLAKIEARGLINPFLRAMQWFPAEWGGVQRAVWATLTATPAQLASALVEVIDADG